jgi:hypothetical protein
VRRRRIHVDLGGLGAAFAEEVTFELSLEDN